MTVLPSLLLACRGPAVEPIPSPAVWRDAGAPADIQVLGATGPDAVSVWVRRVSADGTTVSGDDIDVLVNGAPTSVAVAADGYGRFTLAQPGVAALVAGDSTSRAEVWPTAWPGLPLPEAWLSEAMPIAPELDLVGGGTGLLAIDGGALWWFDRRGYAHTVLAPESPVLGASSGNLDEDGILDAVAWTATTVWLLRGRPDGGMSEVGSLVSTNRTTVAAAIGDPNDDGVADVTVVWAGGPRAGQLDVWAGDGSLGYTPMPNRWLVDTPVGVAVGPSEEGEADEITVLTDDGNWNRFYDWRGEYARAGPSLLLDLPVGSVHDVGDLLGDGGHELLAMSPWESGTPRQVKVMDLQDGARIVTLERGAARVFVHDLDRDGFDDLVFAGEQGDVVWTHHVGEPEDLSSSTLMGDGFFGGGPVGARPAGDLVVAGPDIWAWLDPVLTGPGTLELAAGSLEPFGIVVRDGRFGMIHDLTGPLVVGVPTTLDQLRVWSRANGTFAAVGTLVLPSPMTFVDLAVCDDRAFVLLADQVLAVDLTDPTTPSLVGSTPSTGSAVVCGAGPAGARAAVREGETLHYLDADGAETGSQLYPGLEGFSLAEGAAHTCTDPGCSVLVGPFGPGASGVPVVAGPLELTVDGVPLPGDGVPTLADVDRDGRVDLVLHDAGRIVIHRFTESGFAPPRVWWSRQGLEGPVRFGDLDGDGVDELFVVQAETGRLLLSPVVVPTPPTDTGDTADTGG
ncbi:MAG: VCBS repeat-containing protein [Alphaproteobacteria bacterium]|nr:VCBS repeat-containing protein [Alphaproteobacteria bacterium]MCB9691235.1 VCBS repeat-containing protein [Alphaproteobacteria bacterium]